MRTVTRTVTVTVTVTRRPGPAAPPVPAWPSGPPWQWLRVSHCRARDDPRAAPRARDSADSATVLVTPGSDRRPAAAAAGTERAAGAWAGLPSPGLGPGARPGLVARPRPGHNSVQDRGIIGPIQPGRATPPRWVSVSPAPPLPPPLCLPVILPLPCLPSPQVSRERACAVACASAGDCVLARMRVRACKPQQTGANPCVRACAAPTGQLPCECDRSRGSRQAGARTAARRP